MLADKAYSSTRIRAHLRQRGIKATIPQPSDQLAHRAANGSRGGRPPTFDAETYKQRNVVERAINKLRGTRGVATRYDKREYVWVRLLSRVVRASPVRRAGSSSRVS